MTLRPYVRVVFLAALFSATLGCPQQTAVWVAAGSTSDHLVFNIASHEGGHRLVAFSDLQIWSCSASRDPQNPRRGAAWFIWFPGGTVSDLGMVEYGVLPRGFQEDQPAERLAAGCYRVIISGTGHATFDVMNDGKVIQRDRTSDT